MSFDLDKTVKDAVAFSLNPFRAGRCLSTNKSVIGSPSIFVSIPFEQGDVFRRESEDDWIAFGSSQSLSSRAMSFDTTKIFDISEMGFVSIPFEQGDVFRHS